MNQRIMVENFSGDPRRHESWIDMMFLQMEKPDTPGPAFNLCVATVYGLSNGWYF
jgi:hypothetical protein